ncbi:NAD kinase [Sphingobacterium hungaricum]|uniref:NAD kinase n=1 Tax=Sphingobacterium hungaricum TaxID=2082723 RepID=A0A928V0B0_9SPHI|nr:NAD kinase [Sphingobacterium hungaricum]MBE8715398.1 NAD kinase [Sphingobacterium hungaricum]
MKKKAIAIYGREFNSSVLPYVEQVFDFLEKNDVEVFIYSNFHAFLINQFGFSANCATYTCHEDLPKDVLFVLSLGGDGTMLSAVSIIKDTGIPIAGINFGRLGFLATINKIEIEEALTQILNKEYQLQPRSLLNVESSSGSLFEGNHFALNDMTVFRYDSSSMITIHVKINGEVLNSYWADGLIIATPTGSTAYSLSCGGPIIMPGSGNFVITPISPHNLNVRPIVISAEMQLVLEIESRTEKYIFSSDSRSVTLPTTTSLKINKAKFTINLIRLKADGYFKTLREKLLWGIDVRNY